jgi:hypothetical protein
MWACFKGHGAAVRTLLYGGANRDLRNTVTLAVVMTVTTDKIHCVAPPYY